ncbi:ankyrin repeat domain-containing protein [Paenibacillus sp. GCM10012303]|uniref:ankyrin repeat domain-containing protein n=1 Tax=Paenibacillus sp. GCM10012303 TaxID=3317340 RepID=UPI0036180216
MESTRLTKEVFQAAQSNDASRLQTILAAHPQLANEENEDGLTPLGYAAHFGSREAVQVLLDNGAEANAMSHSKLSFIPSNTALHAAIAGARKMEVIELLLASGAQTDSFDSNGHTALHTAAFHEDNLEIIRLLVRYGADVNAGSEGGETALSLALRQGNNNVAALLREFGALR